MNAQHDDLASRILKVLTTALRVPASSFTEESRFVEDHDGDSMTNMEIAAKLEQEFEITIPDESLPRMVNLAGVRVVISELLTEPNPAGPAAAGAPEATR